MIVTLFIFCVCVYECIGCMYVCAPSHATLFTFALETTTVTNCMAFKTLTGGSEEQQWSLRRGRRAPQSLLLTSFTHFSGCIFGSGDWGWAQKLPGLRQNSGSGRFKEPVMETDYQWGRSCTVRFEKDPFKHSAECWWVQASEERGEAEKGPDKGFGTCTSLNKSFCSVLWKLWELVVVIVQYHECT